MCRSTIKGKIEQWYNLIMDEVITDAADAKNNE